MTGWSRRAPLVLCPTATSFRTRSHAAERAGRHGPDTSGSSGLPSESACLRAGPVPAPHSLSAWLVTGPCLCRLLLCFQPSSGASGLVLTQCPQGPSSGKLLVSAAPGFCLQPARAELCLHVRLPLVPGSGPVATPCAMSRVDLQLLMLALHPHPSLLPSHPGPGFTPAGRLCLWSSHSAPDSSPGSWLLHRLHHPEFVATMHTRHTRLCAFTHMRSRVQTSRQHGCVWSRLLEMSTVSLSSVCISGTELRRLS